MRNVANATGYVGPISTKSENDVIWTYRAFNGIYRPHFPEKLFVHECKDGSWVVQLDRKELRTNFDRAVNACLHIARAKDEYISNSRTKSWYHRRIKSIINCA